jgi:hypothetical protein
VKSFVILVAMSAMLGCTKCGPPNVASRHDAKSRKVPRVCDERSFELRVKTENGYTIMSFRYPDMGGRVVMVNWISIDRIEGDEYESFCSLIAKDMAGPQIASTWVVGTIPPNYYVKGCSQPDFSPGDYTVIVGTDLFEVARRMHVEPDGQIDILDWEKWSEEECEMLRKRW